MNKKYFSNFYRATQLLFLANTPVSFAFDFIDAVLLHLLVEHERLDFGQFRLSALDLLGADFPSR